MKPNEEPERAAESAERGDEAKEEAAGADEAKDEAAGADEAKEEAAGADEDEDTEDKPRVVMASGRGCGSRPTRRGDRR
jgi:hypothetical protein